MSRLQQLSKYWSDSCQAINFQYLSETFNTLSKSRTFPVSLQVQTKEKRSARKRLPFAVVVPTVIRVTWSLGSFLDPPSQLVGPEQWCILIAGHVLGTGHPPCWAKGQNLGHTLGITTHLNLGASDHHGHPPGSDLGSKWAGHSFWAGHCGWCR